MIFSKQYYIRCIVNFMEIHAHTHTLKRRYKLSNLRISNLTLNNIQTNKFMLKQSAMYYSVP